MSKIERLARRWWAAVRAEATAESALHVGVGDEGGASGSESEGGALRTPITLTLPAAGAAAAAALAHARSDVKSESRANAAVPLRPPPLALTRVLGSPFLSGLDELNDDLDDDLTDDEKSSVVAWFMSRLAAKIKPMRDGFFMLDLTKEPSPIRARSGSTVREVESGGGGGGSGASGEGFTSSSSSAASAAASAALAPRKSGSVPRGVGAGGGAARQSAESGANEGNASSDEDNDWYATKEAARRFSDSKARTKSKIGDPCLPPTVLDTRLGFLAFCQRHHCQVRSGCVRMCCAARHRVAAAHVTVSPPLALPPPAPPLSSSSTTCGA